MSCNVVGSDHFYSDQAHILQNNIHQTQLNNWNGSVLYVRSLRGGCR